MARSPSASPAAAAGAPRRRDEPTSPRAICPAVTTPSGPVSPKRSSSERPELGMGAVHWRTPDSHGDAPPESILSLCHGPPKRNNACVTPGRPAASRAQAITPVDTTQELTMTEFSVHTELLKRGRGRPALRLVACNRPPLRRRAGRGADRRGLRDAAVRSDGRTRTGRAVVRERDHRPVGAAIRAGRRGGPEAVTRPSFAFGFLEFDWDPNAPGGVPGFDSSPKRDLRVAAVSPRN